MEVKCEYCGSLIPATADKCPNCGATNINMQRQSSGIPKTIPELQQFCQKHKINLERMHFHIGENYTKPKAFGIYEDNGQFIVYKNKADGSRAIRYQGSDEAYAVNEIYQKLKAELTEMKAHSSGGKSRSGNSNKKQKVYNDLKNFLLGLLKKIGIAVLVFVVILLLGMLFEKYSPETGYYNYNNQSYYYSGSDWYVYRDSDWQKTSVDSDLDDNYQNYANDYYVGETWNYDSDNNWDDDWDDDDWDSDWDDNDWDSGYDSDWDSDW